MDGEVVHASVADVVATAGTIDQSTATDAAVVQIKLCHETGNFMTALALPGQGFVRPIAELSSFAPVEQEGDRVCKPLFIVVSVHLHVWVVMNKDVLQTTVKNCAQNMRRNLDMFVKGGRYCAEAHLKEYLWDLPGASQSDVTKLTDLEGVGIILRTMLGAETAQTWI